MAPSTPGSPVGHDAIQSLARPNTCPYTARHSASFPSRDGGGEEEQHSGRW